MIKYKFLRKIYFIFILYKLKIKIFNKVKY